MTLEDAKALGHRFRRLAWGWNTKAQFLYFDGKNYRKLTGRIVKLTQKDLEADDWEISNPIRNKNIRQLEERQRWIKLIEMHEKITR